MKSGELTIVVSGFGGIVPTGTVTVTQGEKTLFEAAPLVPDGSATRAVVLDAVTGNVRVKYSGDSFYQPAFTVVTLVRGRPHAAR